MSISYAYSLTADFTKSHAILIKRFIYDVQTSNISTANLLSVGNDRDVVNVIFTTSLSTTDKITLDGIVANHVPIRIIFGNNAILRDIKPAGINGGDFSAGSWQTRDINTLEGLNVNIWITLSNNTFTLQEGNYFLNGTCLSYNVKNNQARIFNTTTGTAEFYSINSTANATRQTITSFSGNLVVPSGGNSYVLQHYCQAAQAVNGFGVSNGFGNMEMYTTINIMKI